MVIRRSGGDATPSETSSFPGMATTGTILAGATDSSSVTVVRGANILKCAVVRIDESIENPGATLIGPLWAEVYLLSGNSSTPMLLDKGFVYGGTSQHQVGVTGVHPVNDGDRLLAKLYSCSVAAINWRFEVLTDDTEIGQSFLIQLSHPEFCWDSVASLPNPANAAPGADFTYTIPAGYRALLQWMDLELNSDANAANRSVHMAIKVGAVEIMRFPVAADFAAQTASKLETYFWGVGMTAIDGADYANRTCAFPDRLELQPGMTIAITVTNLQATDQEVVDWILKLQKV